MDLCTYAFCNITELYYLFLKYEKKQCIVKFSAKYYSKWVKLACSSTFKRKIPQVSLHTRAYYNFP